MLQIILMEDDKCAVIYDGFPKARYGCAMSYMPYFSSMLFRREARETQVP
jgi:hypothetical protein